MRRYSFRTVVTENHIKHSFRDDSGCSVAEFVFVTYDPRKPPPDRAQVIDACHSVIPSGSNILDYGTEDDR